MNGARAELQKCPPSSSLPAERVLDSGAVVFPGVFDQHGCPLVLFPAERLSTLTEELSGEEVLHFIHYCLRLHSIRLEESLLSVVVDLRQASLPVARSIAETLLLLEFHRRIIHSVYIVQPKKRDVLKQLVKLLTPGGSKPHRAVQFRRIFLKEVFELSNYIDRSQLPAALGGYLIYCHQSWVAFVKEVDAFVQEFLSVVGRLPSCVSTLQTLSTQPIPSDLERLQDFCSSTQARFQQLRRDLGLDELLKRCECLLEKLRFPENDPCFHAMAGTVLYTHTALEMLHNYNRITAAVEKVELLWQQVFSRAHIQLQILSLQRDAQQAWVEELSRVKESLSAALLQREQSLRGLEDFHHAYDRCGRWYALVLGERVLQDLLWSESGCGSFLCSSSCPEVTELVRLAHLSRAVTDPTLQRDGAQLAHRCMTLRRLLSCPGSAPLRDLQLALQWQSEHLQRPPSPSLADAWAKPPSLSSFDSGFDGTAGALPRTKPLHGHIQEENIASVSDSEDQGFGMKSASIQIVPTVTSDSLNLQIKVKRSAAQPANPWLSLPIDGLESSYCVTITPGSSSPNHSPLGPGPTAQLLSSTLTESRDPPEGDPSLLWDTFDLHPQTDSSERLDACVYDWAQREQQELEAVEQTLGRAAHIIQEEEDALEQERVLDELLRSEDLHKHWPVWTDGQHEMSAQDLAECGVMGLDEAVFQRELLSDTESVISSEVCERPPACDGPELERSEILRDLQALEEQIAEECVKLEALRCCEEEEERSCEESRRAALKGRKRRSRVVRCSALEMRGLDDELWRCGTQSPKTDELICEAQSPEADKFSCGVHSPEEDELISRDQSSEADKFSCGVQSPEEDELICEIHSPEADELIYGAQSSEEDELICEVQSPEADKFSCGVQSPEEDELICEIHSPEADELIYGAQSPEEEMQTISSWTSESLSPVGREDRVRCVSPDSSSSLQDVHTSPDESDVLSAVTLEVSCDPPDGALKVSCDPPDGALKVSCDPPDGALEVSCDPPDGALEVSCDPPDRALEVSSLPPDGALEVSCDPPDGALEVSCNPPDGALEVSCDPPDGALEVSCDPPDGALKVSCDPPDRALKVSCDPPDGALKVSCDLPDGALEVSCDLPDGALKAGETCCVLEGGAFDPGGLMREQQGCESPPSDTGAEEEFSRGAQHMHNNNNNNIGVRLCKTEMEAGQDETMRATSSTSFLQTHSLQVSDYKTPIVLDTGSGLMKAGFADQDLPSIVFPTVIGRPKYEEVMSSSVEREVYVGHEAQLMRGVLALRRPIRHGVVLHWDEMEMIWHHAFQQLSVAPEDHPVLLTEAALNPTQNRMRMVELMFEAFGVPLTFVAAQAVLALYASGRTTGVVLDSGDGVTHTVPVFEGYSLPHAIQRFSLAGADVTLQLQKLLLERGVCLRSSAELEIVREMKESCCAVSLDYEADLRCAGPDLQYTLPDGRPVTLASERFRAPEILFRPELIGRDHCGIHESVFKSVLQSDIDLRRSFLGNILLSGGNTLLSGLPERLQQELGRLLGSDQSVCVRVCVPQDRGSSVWRGGAVCASLPELSGAWISAHEYEEFGPQIVFRKCF